ncbi:MAG: PfkB family carbohydrate kinase [Bryobacterales bacterium]|nr:PfkB family carbohydrate kinase [Bryobacteraceae bacterium]MDW8130848.1 PfkB family carbohydrate kinase [Bryobacterales bacterium]
MTYDIVLVGNYTKDTIVSPAGARQVDGGGFNYGAHVAAMMGLRAAAVTRLAPEDRRVVERLEALGITVFPAWTPSSTRLELRYPGSNPDERIITVSSSAGPITLDQVRPLAGRAWLLNGSFRGEIPLELVRELRGKAEWLAADVQGFLRENGPDGVLRATPWSERDAVLGSLDVLKADAVEAAALAGEEDPAAAARRIAAWGPRAIVVTHRDGVLVLCGGTLHAAPFRHRELRGRSGRGDTCVAAYLCRRLEGASPWQATLWAAAVTSLKLEAEGPLRASRAEIERFLREHYEV